MKQYILIMEDKSYFRTYIIKLKNILLDVYISKNFVFIFCLFMPSIQFLFIPMSEILIIFKITNVWTEDR